MKNGTERTHFYGRKRPDLAPNKRFVSREKETLRSIDSINLRLNKLSGEVNKLLYGASKEDKFFQELIDNKQNVSVHFCNENSESGIITDNFKCAFILIDNGRKLFIQKSAVATILIS